MFNYPSKAFFNRFVAKNKIYANAKISDKIRTHFIQQLDKIIWLYKLAPETTNIKATDGIQEIQIFALELKTEELNESVLRTIDSAIRHPIAYQLKYEGRIRFVMASKSPNKNDPNKWLVGEYFWSDWQNEPVEQADSETATLPKLPIALNLQHTYETLLRAHIPLSERPQESIEAQLERIHSLKQAERAYSQIENQIKKTKQFNRKLALNQQLKELKNEIEKHKQ